MGAWVRADAKMGSLGEYVYRRSRKTMPKMDYSYRSSCEDWPNPLTPCYACYTTGMLTLTNRQSYLAHAAFSQA
jgi:hypothetical protein